MKRPAMHPAKLLLTLVIALPLAVPATLAAQPKTTWRAATPDELAAALPARAPVEKERIERCAPHPASTGHTRQARAGVALITAGYSADGKYHYLCNRRRSAASPAPPRKASVGSGDDSGCFYDAAIGSRGTRQPTLHPDRARGFRLCHLRPRHSSDRALRPSVRGDQ